MPLFTISCRDKPESFDLRARTRDAHLAYLAAVGAAVRLGGPRLDAQGRSIGSLLIVEAEDADAAQALADADPYARAGLFASVRIEPWRLVVGGFAEPSSGAGP